MDWQEASGAAISGSAPIGSIVAWHKSMDGTPTTLPDGWVECSGQTVNDPDSPYNGKAVPNLNRSTMDGSTNSGMFLRGGPTSGVYQADATAVNGLTMSVTARAWSGSILLEAGSSVTAGTVQASGSTNVTINGDAETRPANMTVLYIMRIK